LFGFLGWVGNQVVVVVGDCSIGFFGNTGKVAFVGSSWARLLGTLIQVRGESGVLLGFEVKNVLIAWSTNKVGMAVFFGVDRVGGARELLEWELVDPADVPLRARLFSTGYFSVDWVNGNVSG
jgi:hypothetical protein